MTHPSFRAFSFALAASALSTHAFAQSAVESVLVPGEAVSGEITDSDAYETSRNTYTDAWTLVAEEGEAFAVTLRSDDFDTYLIVHAPDGSVLVQDDDSAGDLNSRAEFRTFEAGRYTVLATAFSSDGRGSYSLVADAIDPSLLADPRRALSRTPIAFGDTVEGTLERSDALIPSRDANADGYTFEAEAGQRFEINLTSTSFDTYLRLVGPTGESVMMDDDGGESTNSRIRYTAAHAGTYTIVATAYSSDGAGAYTVSLTEGFVDAMDAAQSVALGDEVSATLVDGMANFVVDLNAGQTVIAEAMSDDVDTVIEVYDASENFFGSDDDGGEGTNSRLRFAPIGAQTYRFLVRSYSGTADGPVTFTINEAPPVTVDPVNLRVGRSVEGILEAGDAVSQYGMIRDVFTLDLDPGDVVTLSAETSLGGELADFDVYVPDVALRVIDPTGDEIYDMNGNTGSRVLSASIGGTYLVTVGSGQADTAYTLTAVEGDHSLTQWPEEVAGVELGSVIEGSLGEDAITHPDRGAYYEAYVLTLEEGAGVTIGMTADFDTYLELRDSDWRLVSSNDDGGEGLNSMLTEQLNAGSYHIVATQFSGGAGAYTLTVQGGAAEAFEARTVEIDDTVEATLSATDARDMNGTPAHFYQVEAEAGQGVELVMMSEDFDCYIDVYDAFGELMQMNDDGGTGTNARVTFTFPQTGTYTIVARSYGGGSGDYVLEVRGSLAEDPQPNYDFYGVGGGLDGEYGELDDALIEFGAALDEMLED